MCVEQIALTLLRSFATAKYQLPHAFPKVPREERIQERVDAGVEVSYEKRERSEQGAEVAASVVVAGPMLPHLTCVER